MKLRKKHKKYLLALIVLGLLGGVVLLNNSAAHLTSDNKVQETSVYKAEDRHKLEQLIHTGARHND